jgi:hypothetical protein
LNTRPLAPQASALAKLSYAPTHLIFYQDNPGKSRHFRLFLTTCLLKLTSFLSLSELKDAIIYKWGCFVETSGGLESLFEVPNGTSFQFN